MSNRKSLGHSPLGYNVIGNSNFDFIPDYNSVIETDDTERSSRQLESNSKADEKNNHVKPQKKIVSYYIEENVTNRLRDFADDHKSSYSAAATEAIFEYVTRKGY